MSRRIADLMIKIGADSYEFQQRAKQVEKGLEDMSKKLTAVGKTMSLTLSAPIAALGAVSLKAFDDSAKALAKVDQAIKSTGGAARLSTSELSKFASELQGKTLFDDDNIMNNATAQLLTFTNIAGENFKRTQAVALDLATVLDGDLKSASIQLGKALNDPVKNLTALSRAGIQFSKDQTSTIKHLAETNRLAEAQALILQELERQYGGQAQAASKVGLGALQQLKNNFGDFLEQIGKIIMPLVNKVAGVLSTVVSGLQSMNPQLQEVIVLVAGIAAAIGPLALGIGGVMKMLPMLATMFGTLMGPVGLVVGAMLALGAAFFYAYTQKKKLQEDMTTGFEGMSNVTLERMLKENKRLQEVNERESPWQGNSPYTKLTYALNKGKRRDSLKMEEDALTEAIRRNKTAIEERTNAEAEAKRISEDLEEILDGVNTETARGTGLINDLKTQIDDLEKKKLLPDATLSDIAAINGEIDKLQQKLAEINTIKPHESLVPSNLGGINDNPVGADIEFQMPDVSSLMSKAQEQMAQIRDVVRNGIYGWADEISTKLQNNIAQTETVVASYTDALTAKGWKFSEALTFVTQSVSQVMDTFSSYVQDFLANSIVNISEGFGKMIAGDFGFNDVLSSILTSLAGFLKELGAQLIKAGVLMLGLQKAFAALKINPGIAIAVGAAMVIAATVMTSALSQKSSNVPKLAKGGLAYGPTYAMVGDNPGASVDPEVIAPLSKLKNMMTTGASNVSVTLSGQLTARGRDLVYVLGKENFRTDVLGG